MADGRWNKLNGVSLVVLLAAWGSIAIYQSGVTAKTASSGSISDNILSCDGAGITSVACKRYQQAVKEHHDQEHPPATKYIPPEDRVPAIYINHACRH
jgi:hypothetical protein